MVGFVYPKYRRVLPIFFGDDIRVSEDEYEQWVDEGLTDEEIREKIEARKDTTLKELDAIKLLMEEPFYKNLPKEAKKPIENAYSNLEVLLYCECDEYETNPDCYICLQRHRRSRYGFNVHNTDCMCNDCTYGQYGHPRADY